MESTFKMFRRCVSSGIDIVKHAKYHAAAMVKRLLRHAARLRMSPGDARRDVFSEIYSQNLWGRESDSKFFSGVGSRGNAATIYVDRMCPLLQELGDELRRPLKIVDLGCGDFQVGRALLSRLPGASYVGCDIVPELIDFNNSAYSTPNVTFQTLDIISGDLPDGDVCLVRQVLQHLSNSDILAFLRRQRYSVLYVTEGQPSEIVGRPNPDKPASANVRFDWKTGKGRGVELDKPPFDYSVTEAFRAFAPPREIIVTHRVDGAMRASSTGIRTDWQP